MINYQKLKLNNYFKPIILNRKKNPFFSFISRLQLTVGILQLIKLTEIILTKEKTKGKKHLYIFDPSYAMCICNIWDNVRILNIIYQHIVKRLSLMKKDVTF